MSGLTAINLIVQTPALYVTGSGKTKHFAYSIKIEILLYLASIVNNTSVLCMSIYNYCTFSELQHFVMQPLLLPILRVVNLHVLILKIVGFSQIRSHKLSLHYTDLVACIECMLFKSHCYLAGPVEYMYCAMII